MSNPLIDNPNQTPDFQAVKPEHFLPAIDAAYDESMAIVDEIKNCDDPLVQQFILGKGDGPIKSLE